MSGPQRSRTKHLAAAGITVACVAAVLAGCSPAPDAVQGQDGQTLPEVTELRLAGNQDFARARADAVEVDAELAAEVERLSNAVARAEACGESGDDAGRELAAALDGAGLAAEDRQTMESLSTATIAQANAERRGDAGCN